MIEETLSHREIARMIDISAVQAALGETDIRNLVAHAKQYGFGAVHVLPAWVTFTRSLLHNADGIALGSPVGFPSGGTHSAIKRAEALQMVADGVDELDMVLNIGKLRSGDDSYVFDELRAVIGVADVPVKAILETHYLTNDEIRRACLISIEAGAQYVKTSTGWTSTGATLENVKFIASCIEGRIGIKASGGIRDLDTLIQMYKLGVRRFGINLLASVEIIKACEQLPGSCVRITP